MVAAGAGSHRRIFSSTDKTFIPRLYVGMITVIGTVLFIIWTID
jgi:hypothetical protein